MTAILGSSMGWARVLLLTGAVVCALSAASMLVVAILRGRG